MGCFLGCFGSSKDRKRRKRRYKVIPRDQNPKCQDLVQADVSLVQNIKNQPSNALPESRAKEEPVNLSTRKKVTFDTNVTTYEHVQVYDSTESLLEKNEQGETFPKSAHTQSNSGSQDGSDVVSVGPYPPDYRYGNCLESDDEVVDSDYEDEDDDGLEDEDDYDDEDGVICQEVWCESIPIPSTESRVESSSVGKVGSNSNARDRSAYVVAVLNPVENLTQWKALKSKRAPPPNFNQQKENSSLNSTPFAAPKDQETAVDASLSNWLVSNTPNNKKVGECYNNTELEPISSGKSVSQGSATTSVRSIEDRPILGALTVDELKQFSASSLTLRKSPSRSPDEMAIIGSVGSYWSHTDSAKSLSSTSSYKGIPNTTSKYREDKKVKWHNTPFETRLERALNGGVGGGAAEEA